MSTHRILLRGKDLPHHTTGQMVSRAQSHHYQNLQSCRVYTCGGFQRFHHRGSKCMPSRGLRPKVCSHCRAYEIDRKFVLGKNHHRQSEAS